ncbi:hypothetical protein NX059_010220 [Plenodomus lindquistii]|nr:hypothetical protein NX059_010220 [Plenodomus lindquistii]
MNSDIGRLKHQIGTFKARNVALCKENTSLKEDVCGLNGENATLRDENKRMKDVVAALHRQGGRSPASTTPRELQTYADQMTGQAEFYASQSSQLHSQLSTAKRFVKDNLGIDLPTPNVPASYMQNLAPGSTANTNINNNHFNFNFTIPIRSKATEDNTIPPPKYSDRCTKSVTCSGEICPYLHEDQMEAYKDVLGNLPRNRESLKE